MAFFVPSILTVSSHLKVRTNGVQGQGYAGIQANLHSAYPYLACCGWMALITWASDRYRSRFPFLLLGNIMSIIGLVLMPPGLGLSNNVRYFGVFFFVMACNTNMGLLGSYGQNNVVGKSKRAVLVALQGGLGGCGGIVSSCIFRSQDAPYYRPGLYTSIALQCTLFLVVCFMTWRFTVANQKADRGEIVLNGLRGWRHAI